MNVVWDEHKRRLNLQKHGVDFADAVGVLLDPWSRTCEDPDAAGETRLVTMGVASTDALLVVVWTVRDDDIRIISARSASPGEARVYREQSR